MTHHSRLLLPVLFSAFVCVQCGADVRLVDAAGSISNVGLLQVRTDAGFGTVCGANPAAADVVCRSLGYSFGSVSTSPCGFYGGANLCGAPGSPVVRCSCHALVNHFCACYSNPFPHMRRWPILHVPVANGPWKNVPGHHLMQLAAHIQKTPLYIVAKPEHQLQMVRHD